MSSLRPITICSNSALLISLFACISVHLSPYEAVTNFLSYASYLNLMKSIITVFAVSFETSFLSTSPNTFFKNSSSVMSLFACFSTHFLFRFASLLAYYFYSSLSFLNFLSSSRYLSLVILHVFSRPFSSFTKSSSSISDFACSTTHLSLYFASSRALSS